MLNMVVPSEDQEENMEVFHNTGTSNTATPENLTKVDKDIKFTHACSYGFKKDGRNVCSHMRVEWTGKLEIDREGDYEFRLCSDDGSRLFLNDN
jgi:hypothetical protein